MNAALALATLRALPVRDFAEVFGAAPLLVLAPHPDDETLGCGGIIAEACARRHPVHVAILTDGARSHPNSPTWPAARLASRRRQEAMDATTILGLPPERLTFLDVADGAAPHDGAEFSALLDRLVDRFAPAGIGTICATWQGDPHGDHGAAARLADAACARLRARHLAYPVWAWTMPADAELPAIGRGARIDIARHLPVKRRAIAAHASQHRGLIDDDPDGFVLDPAFLRLFDTAWETVFEPE